MASTKRSRKKRRSDNNDEDHRKDLKRLKRSVESSLQEYLCSISHQLPIHPVTGMDGEIYERSEIEKWIQTRKGSGLDVTSPLTNEVMGEQLIPSKRVYNAIQVLIQENDIDSDIAKSWLERVKQIDADKKIVAETRAKADAGDGIAMYNMGTWYNFGIRGLPVDRELAAQWYKKSSDVYHPVGMAAHGMDLVYGFGNVTKNVALGTMLVGRAAGEGCHYAYYVIGMWYSSGAFGFPEDLEKTKHYLGKIVNGEGCKYDSLSALGIEDVKKWLADNV